MDLSLDTALRALEQVSSHVNDVSLTTYNRVLLC